MQARSVKLQRAGREWKEFGERQILTTFGDTIYLTELEVANEAWQNGFRGAEGLAELRSLGKRLSETPEAERPGKVIVAILTDGYENASTNYTYEKVAERVRHQQETYSWEFVFLAANQDAVLSAAKLAISAEDAISFDATPAGTHVAYARMSDAVSERRQRPGRKA